ncbi:hydroxymethylbilane synthase [Clostridium massiliodielmoense]|uniref:hydroxymethylbilane synthase n=1 Tax=Clostridium massiliodielmoense TaxID=1776385 RepID=UPI000A26768F|nr:hydroxymethylbilane synthase [Clostridium massiliodielmoense]
MKIVVGSRGSKLALTQTNWIINEIKQNYPQIQFEVKIISTKGDRIQHIALDKIGDKGLFVKEIEEQLISGDIDMAVHSMKDMSTEMPEKLKFSYVPKREDYRDVLILNKKYNSIDELPRNAKIGTGSKRRKYQLLRYRDDLNIVSIRGNVETRINKIETENLHGVVLAVAGIKRLNIEEKLDYNIFYLNENIMLPSPAQGILALEIRKDRKDLEEILKSIEDKNSTIQAIAERAFLKGVNGGCHVPIGAICNINKDNVQLTGLLGKEDGSKIVKKSLIGDINDAENIGYNLAEIVLKEIN